MNAEQTTSMIARNRFPLLPHCGNKREREAETAPSTIPKRRGYAFDFTVGFKLKVLKKEQNCTLPAFAYRHCIHFRPFPIFLFIYDHYHQIYFISCNHFFQGLKSPYHKKPIFSTAA